MIGARFNRNGDYRSDILKRFLMEFYMSTVGHYKNGHPNDWVREASIECWQKVMKDLMNPAFGDFVSDDIKWRKIK